MSKVIVVEGLDGAGKANGVETVRRVLEARGKKVKVVIEPGGTEVGNFLRNYVKSFDRPDISNESEILLFFLSRSVLLDQEIKPALARGEYVVLDRFFRTTQAYQGQDEESSLLIDSLVEKLKLEELIDLEIYLDIKVSTSRVRTGRRPVEEACSIEARADSFFEAARDIYIQNSINNPKTEYVNAELPIEAVSRQITNLVTNLLNTEDQ